MPPNAASKARWIEGQFCRETPVYWTGWVTNAGDPEGIGGLVTCAEPEVGKFSIVWTLCVGYLVLLLVGKPVADPSNLKLPAA
jgi:hypothetical protein